MSHRIYHIYLLMSLKSEYTVTYMMSSELGNIASELYNVAQLFWLSFTSLTRLFYIFPLFNQDSCLLMVSVQMEEPICRRALTSLLKSLHPASVFLLL